MADRNRRFTFAAFALPFLFLAMSGLARANTIVVNTLDGGSQPFPLCTPDDAVVAANTAIIHSGCPAGTGNYDTIEFIVTGTILIDDDTPLEITGGTLFIDGPQFGCSGAGPCGVTIEAGSTLKLFIAGFGHLQYGYCSHPSYLTLNDGRAADGARYSQMAANSRFKIACSTTISRRIVTLHGGKGGAIYINSAGDVNIVNSTFCSIRPRMARWPRRAARAARSRT